MIINKSTLLASLLLFMVSCHSMQSQEDTLRVFLLAGQSNMIGQGQVNDASIPGTLDHALINEDDSLSDILLDDQGSYLVHNDVWVSFREQHAALSVGFGFDELRIGPELGIGIELGEFYADDVLLVKTCWGNRSLAVDFLPPSAEGETGEFFTQMIVDFNLALENLPSTIPAIANQAIKLEGFIWHQGWNDGETIEFGEAYEQNLIFLVQDLREILGVAELPVVIANTGQGGFDFVGGPNLTNVQNLVLPAQEAASNALGETVSLVDTRPFFREASESPVNELVHWNDNALSFLDIGLEVGKSMISLLDSLGTDIETISEQFLTYPNPCREQLNLAPSLSAKRLMVYNSEGIKVLEQNFETSISVAALRPGVYIIEGRGQENQVVFSQAFLKQ